MSRSLAAVACHFNPCGYRRPRDNFLQFRRTFFGCPLWTVEVSFDGAFHLDADWQITATSRQVLWQKEQLVNWAAARLPAEFDRVAWIDADLLFLNPDWADDAARLLDDVPVVQLFETCHWTEAHGRIELSRPSLLRKRRDRLQGHGAPGGAWAARREFLTRHGLYAGNVLGGGDSVFAEALFGINAGQALRHGSRALLADAVRWSRGVCREVAGRVGCVPGDVVHLYHGAREHRRYVERTAILRETQFDPVRDIRLGENGLWEWSSDKPALHARVRAYFAQRREDDP